MSITGSSGAKVAITHKAYNFARKLSALKNMFSSQRGAWPDLQWVEVDDVISSAKRRADSAGPALPAGPEPSDIAFLQYTSGSTSEPKGVMISHDNLAHNESVIVKELNADESTVCVSWLPQYHDMGLIGSYLGTLFCKGSGFYLSPLSYLKDPILWVQAMSVFKATHTQAPNFAYALTARKFKEAVTIDPEQVTALNLDLSSVQNMLNAAEPVDAGAIGDFYSLFEQYGLKRGVIVPTYGLAEHTVFVCSRGKTVLKLSKSDFEQGAISITDAFDLGDADKSKLAEEGTHVVVGCGFPTLDNEIDLIIVDEARNKLGEDMIGEIWVRSPSKAMGYFSLPELTQEDFHARLADAVDDDESSGFLRTGDLGFLHGGELFVCGRSKDLIIVRGSNHFPQDIERSAEHRVSELRQGCSAAFSVPNRGSGSESVVYVAEVCS